MDTQFPPDFCLGSPRERIGTLRRPFFGKDSMRVPIVAGALRGKWWLLTSRGQPGRVLTGTYEPAHTKRFVSLVRPGSVVLDLGAHTGYYTLLASALVGGTGLVYAFEPNPRNCHYLRRHLKINRVKNVEVEESAVSDSDGHARFDADRGSGTGHLAEAGGIEVRTISLDAFCTARGVRPSLIKVDVEGAEVGALEGARATLERFRPIVMLSTHGDQLHRSCLAFFASLDYHVGPISGDNVESTSELLALPRPGEQRLGE